MKYRGLVVVGVALLSASYIGCASPAQDRIADAWAKLKNAASEQLRAQVLELLKDPGSAEFRNVSLFHQGAVTKEGFPLSGGVWILCGEVNSKNALGGYVGFTRFYSLIARSSDGKEPEESDVTFDDFRSEKLHQLFVKHYSGWCKDEVWK